MKNEFYQQILKKNKAWVESKLNLDPNFFKKLSKTQEPQILWIGCSDSRVHANEITGAEPGEVFVHRNIANMVIHSDMNVLSVLDYAVNVLKVKEIIVCGHYGCGGVKTAMGNSSVGIIDNWIRHIKDSYRFNRKELEKITDEKKKFDRYVELNAIEQVLNLGKTSIVQNAWAKGQELHIHGWVYGIGSGVVKDLEVTLNSNSDLEAVFKLDIED